MKRIIFTLLFVLVMGAPVFGQYPPAGTKEVGMRNGKPVSVPTYRLYNGEVLTQEQITDSQNTISNIVAKAGSGAFVKFSNGSIVYLGKMLSVRYGLIPKTTYSNPATIHTNEVILIDYGYTVHDVSSEGCRITCDTHPWQPDYKDIFVVGLSGYSDREYVNILMLRSIGSYAYSTVSGGTRTIPKFETGVPCTKEQYLEYMKNP